MYIGSFKRRKPNTINPNAFTITEPADNSDGPADKKQSH